MEIKRRADDLFSHMELLGMANILANDSEIGQPLVLGWKNPGVFVLDTAMSRLEMHDAAVALWRFKELSIAQAEKLGVTIPITRKGGAKKKVEPQLHSPLSPRIAKELSQGEWEEYFAHREHVVDAIWDSNPTFVSLLGALGSASYWGKPDRNGKVTGSLDLGASSWEMAPRNQGSEFMLNKYLQPLTPKKKNMYECMQKMTARDIEERLMGHSESFGEKRNACGFHRPVETDMFMAWIAYHGINSFPTRPVASTYRKTDSLSVGTVALGRERVFILPVTRQPVTLNKYEAILRSRALYEAARLELDGLQQHSHYAQAWSVLHELGVSSIFWFQRYRGGSDNCPEYWAMRGKVFTA